MALCGSATQCLVSKAIIIFQSDLLFIPFPVLCTALYIRIFCAPHSFQPEQQMNNRMPTINQPQEHCTQIDFNS